MNGPKINGRVALVEDEYTLVINRGAEAGVAPGMTFVVLAEASRCITDPESGRELGRLPEEKLRVKVFDVHPLFSRAETYARERQTSPIVDGMADLARHVGVTLHEGALSTALAPDEVVTVNVGDEVELVGDSWSD